MRTSNGLTQRLARYSASVMFITGLGLIYVVGTMAEVPLKRLWFLLFWGSFGALLLGWAVGHAAGRLVIEAQDPKRIEDEKLNKAQKQISEEEVAEL